MIAADVALLPAEYWLCVAVIVGAFFYAIHQRGQSWLPAFLTVLGTAVAWYMVEPIYFEDFLISFPPSALSEAYSSVFVFLVALTFFTPVLVKLLRPRRSLSEPEFRLSAEQIVVIVILLWLCLLAIGIYRMDGDWQNALFPLYGRSGGAHMWGRFAGSDAGAYGFLVSTGAYLYVLVLSLLGLLLTLTRAPTLRVVLVVCILVSWPYAFLQGSRNVALAVITPSLIAYLLIGKRSLFVKTAFAIVALFGVDFLMRGMIELRNVGFSGTLQDLDDTKHLGLNMASELAYIVDFLDKNILEVSWGLGYMTEALNVIPRAMWPEKPALGIEYAVARGFGGSDADIGVFATISTGVIGQGVLNFGVWAGPMVAGIIMATWIAVLTRLRDQGGALRTALFLVGLGLTFNLGRDITLLVLFPFIFGYIGVRILEAREMQQRHLSRERAIPGAEWRRVPHPSTSQGDS